MALNTFGALWVPKTLPFSTAIRYLLLKTTAFGATLGALPFLVDSAIWFLSGVFRRRSIPRDEERVFIALIGDVSLGRAIAHRYAARGAYLYIDGRREAVETIAAECEAIHRQRGSTNRKYETQVFIGSLLDVGGPRSPGITDHTDAPCIKNVLRAWGGFDTMVIIPVIDAPTRNLQQMVKVKNADTSLFISQPRVMERQVLKENVVHWNEVSARLAVIYAPILQLSSLVPSLVVISSLVSVSPGSTKFLLVPTPRQSMRKFQSLMTTKRSVHFTFVMPALLSGAPSYARNGPSLPAPYYGLTLGTVAERCISFADSATGGFIHLPVWLPTGFSMLYRFIPTAMETFSQWKRMLSER